MDNKKKPDLPDLSKEFDIEARLEETWTEVEKTAIEAPIEDVTRELEELRAQDKDASKGDLAAIFNEDEEQLFDTVWAEVGAMSAEERELYLKQRYSPEELEQRDRDLKIMTEGTPEEIEALMARGREKRQQKLAQFDVLVRASSPSNKLH